MKTSWYLLQLSLLLFCLAAFPRAAYAYYDPGIQRWINRDPIGEKGHLLLQRNGRSQVGGKDQLTYRFCHNDPVNRFDIDGCVDVPPLVIQYYVWQGPIAVATALLDWCAVKRACEALAETPDQEAFGQTVLSQMLTLANIAAIITQCPNGGAIYRHIWFDEECNCQKEFVVICNGNGA